MQNEAVSELTAYPSQILRSLVFKVLWVFEAITSTSANLMPLGRIEKGALILLIRLMSKSPKPFTITVTRSYEFSGLVNYSITVEASAS
ncbi:hypothetical protein BB561_004624 [Smittium simulii]|uniref:Uncharacterized protein n=1 Tax=Smittium simulii TaxID=133385 RepID=A0A2T9YFC3_9FUNG|nr:hypothetical protein BB561_004624 [Smittium simulii]